MEDQVEALASISESRASLQKDGTDAGTLAADLNGLLAQGEGRLRAVDPRQTVSLLVVDASLRDVVASLLAAGVVHVERP